MTELGRAAGLSAAEVMHGHVTTIPGSVTVGEVREYFAASGSRRLALLVDGERYVGSIARSGLPEEADGAVPAARYAVHEPTILPDAPADRARELALAASIRRVPVVDEAGTLLGIVAIDEQHVRFCGT